MKNNKPIFLNVVFYPFYKNRRCFGDFNWLITTGLIMPIRIVVVAVVPVDFALV